jgi:hypothetical protein
LFLLLPAARPGQFHVDHLQFADAIGADRIGELQVIDVELTWSSSGQ